jgi:hypothetical protein
VRRSRVGLTTGKVLTVVWRRRNSQPIHIS